LLVTRPGCCTFLLHPRGVHAPKVDGLVTMKYSAQSPLTAANAILASFGPVRQAKLPIS